MAGDSPDRAGERGYMTGHLLTILLGLPDRRGPLVGRCPEAWCGERIHAASPPELTGAVLAHYACAHADDTVQHAIGADDQATERLEIHA